jgi:hypothetical protein
MFRTLIILVQDKNTSLKLPVGAFPLQLVDLHRNRRYFVIKLHTWFCLSDFLKTNITYYVYFFYIRIMYNSVISILGNNIWGEGRGGGVG